VLDNDATFADRARRVAERLAVDAPTVAMCVAPRAALLQVCVLQPMHGIELVEEPATVAALARWLELFDAGRVDRSALYTQLQPATSTPHKQTQVLRFPPGAAAEQHGRGVIGDTCEVQAVRAEGELAAFRMIRHLPDVAPDQRRTQWSWDDLRISCRMPGASAKLSGCSRAAARRGQRASGWRDKGLHAD
jgi:hypothetical protein